MPFDQTDFKLPETKVDATLDGLITWLEMRDPTTEYEWGDHRNCLICQWLSEEAGEPVKVVGLIEGYATESKRRMLPCPVENPLEGIAYDMPRNFGAALARARALRDAGR